MRLFLSTLLVLTISIATDWQLARSADSWPQWRGAAQNGVADGKSYPLTWAEDSGIRWKIEIQGVGGSTPILSGDMAYLTSGIEGKNTLLAVDAASGDVQWQVALGDDRGNKHRKGSGSNPSAVTDGKSLFAYFRSGDLASVDLEGQVRWKTNLQQRYGEDTLWWDLGTSPLITDNAVIVAVMQSGPSYLVAFDKESGDELWKIDRMLDAPEEAAQCYATPLAVAVNGKDMIAVMGADHLTIHDVSNGRELARLGGFNPGREKFWRSISGPVAEGNIIVCPYARGGTLTAVHMDQLVAGKGKHAIAWVRELGSDVPTPAATGGRVYVVGDKQGLISCLDINNGETVWEVQLPKSRIGYSSSPLVAANHLYVTQENATTYVIGPLDASSPAVVATNRLADEDLYTVASLVPLGDSLLLRSRHHLYRIAGN